MKVKGKNIVDQIGLWVVKVVKPSKWGHIGDKNEREGKIISLASVVWFSCLSLKNPEFAYLFYA